jgi:hypothetical protein
MGARVRRELLSPLALARRLRGLAPARVLETLVWAVPLAGLELLGRKAQSDAVDAFGVVLLSFLGVTAWIRLEGRLRRLLAERVLPRLAAWRPEVGLDFRRDPPLPEALPRGLVACFAVTLCAAAAVVATNGVWPTAVRAALRATSGLLYLTLLTLLWAALIAGGIGLFLLPLAYLRAELLNSRRWRLLRRRFELPAALAWFLCLCACAWLVPPQWALVALFAALAFFAPVASLRTCRELWISWKVRGAPRSTLRSFRWSSWLSGSAAWLVALCTLLVVIARGERFVGGGSSETGLTAFLGLLFLWPAACGCAYVFVREGLELCGCCRADPARPAPVRVRISGALDARERDHAQRVLAAAGMRAVFAPVPRRPTDVPLVLGSSTPSAIPPERLGDADVLRRLARRGEIVRRRELLHRLRVIFKQLAARGPFEKGEGFWLAPHLWFITRVARDSDDPDTWFVGPTYRKAIDRAARHHLHQVLGALELDLVFLEDGVGFRGLKRVLGVLFEHYDVFGGRRLDDERPFLGLPGIRVMIQDYELESPWRRTQYPEPDYEEIGRARILLVFKERGEGDSEEEVETPEAGLRLRPPRRVLVPR